MCYNVLIMASVSSQPASLLIHMSARRQMAFVPFRYQGANLQRLHDPAVCDAVSRPNCGSDARANDCTLSKASGCARSIEEVICPKHREHSLRAMQERSLRPWADGFCPSKPRELSL